jgi:hypothetical protein
VWVDRNGSQRVPPDMSDVYTSVRSQLRTVDRHSDLYGESATGRCRPKPGSPFDCIYCTNSVSEGRDNHMCDPDTVATQLWNSLAADCATLNSWITFLTHLTPCHDHL